MEPEDVLFTGGNNTPGLAKQALMYAYVEDISSMQCGCDDSAPVHFTDIGTMNQDIVMKSGKSFHTIYFTDETADLSHEVVGETDGKAIKNILDFFHPKDQAQFLGFLSEAKNRKGFVFIAYDKDCKKRVFGNTCTPAKLSTGKGGTMKKNGERKGTTISFEYTASDVAPYFEGRVDLVGAGYSAGSENDYQTLFVN